MKNKADVKWSFNAEDDLLKIIEYISDDSIQNARKVFERIKKETRELVFFPERGRIVPELEKQNFLIFREIVVAPWRIIYRISAGSVFILAVIDSRQNVEDILLKKIIRIERGA